MALADARHWAAGLLRGGGAEAVDAAVRIGAAPPGVTLDGDALAVRTVAFGRPIRETVICADVRAAAREAARPVPGADGRLVREWLPRPIRAHGLARAGFEVIRAATDRARARPAACAHRGRRMSAAARHE